MCRLSQERIKKSKNLSFPWRPPVVDRQATSYKSLAQETANQDEASLQGILILLTGQILNLPTCDYKCINRSDFTLEKFAYIKLVAE